MHGYLQTCKGCQAVPAAQLPGRGRALVKLTKSGKDVLLAELNYLHTAPMSLFQIKINGTVNSSNPKSESWKDVAFNNMS
jgi:hypothetical protein